MQNLVKYRIAYCLALAGSLLLFNQDAVAQIVPDDTLGAESSVVVPDVMIDDVPSDRIEGGAVRGAMLFHSFEEFSIGEGRGGYFFNPDGVNTVLSRVTGARRSDILGTLGVLGDADLVFLNPNGILFGPDAQLDLRGSFTATTAGAVEIPGGETFSALESEVPSLLEVNVEAPIGLAFEGVEQGLITNEGNLFAEQDLTLVADELNLQGQLFAGDDLTLKGQDTVLIRDSESTPFIAAAGDQLTVQGNQLIDIFALSHPDSGLFSGGNMALRSDDAVNGDAHFWSGGSFRVETLDQEVGELFSPVDPIIRALGDVTIGAYQGSSLHILAGGSADIGTAVITAPDAGAVGIDFLQETIQLSDGTVVEINGGAQPTLDVRAGIAPEIIGSVPFNNPSGVNPATDFFLNQQIQLADPEIEDMPTSANITVGDVIISDANGLVILTNQYEPNIILEGSIFVTAEGVLRRGIDASSFANFGRQGGTVYLDSRNDVEIINSSVDVSGVETVGDIVINAVEAVRFEQQDRQTIVANRLLAGADGEGGDIRITAATLDVLKGAQLTVSTFGNGNAGNIEITVRDRVRFDGTTADSQFTSAAFSRVGRSATGTGGNVIIDTGVLEVLNGAGLLSNTLGNGNAGNVEITARDLVRFDGTSADGEFDSAAFSNVFDGAKGMGGNVIINTNILEVRDGAQLRASTTGDGDAGNIEITARDRVAFDNGNAFSGVREGATGKGGNVIIIADTLDILSGARLTASTASDGDAGNVEIIVRDRVVFDDRSAAFSSVESGAIGAGGNLVIDASALNILNGAQLIASTEGTGDAGNVEITVRDHVALDTDESLSSAVFSSVNSGATGNGGNVLIQANSLDILNGSQLVASTEGNGNAGNIEVTVRDRVRFEGTRTDGRVASAASSSVRSGATGTGGNVLIQANSLDILNGAQLAVATQGTGDAGSVKIKIHEYIVFDDQSAAFSSVESGAVGSGGNLVIDTNTLNILNGSQLIASTSGNGDSGHVEITAQEQVNLHGVVSTGQSSGIFTGSNASATGQGNDIRITTPNLQVQNGAVLSASTFNSQLGGNIVLWLGRLSVLDGGQVITSSLSSGAAGNIEVDAIEGIQLSGSDPTFASRIAQVPDINLEFAPQSRLSVQSRATGAAGNIVIGAAGTTPSVLLDNGGQINAESAAVDGGNITVNLTGPLLLRNGSLISATAGTSESGGNGGNIILDVGLVFAIPQEDSDITANAFEGDGGRVEISANGLFGIEFRDELTPLSDITASSEQGNPGDVNINTPEIDPTQGLTVLPEEPRETEITGSCQTAATQDSVEFFNLGRGGAPPSPGDVTGDQNASADWISLELLGAENTPEVINRTIQEEEDPAYALTIPRVLAQQLTAICQQN